MHVCLLRVAERGLLGYLPWAQLVPCGKSEARQSSAARFRGPVDGTEFARARWRVYIFTSLFVYIAFSRDAVH